MDIRLRDNPIHQETLENTIDEHLSSAERERVIYRVQAEVLNNGLIAFENAQEMEQKLVDYYNKAGKNIKKEILDLYERLDEWDVAELNKYNRLNNLLEKVKYQANLMGSKEKLAVKNGLKEVYKDQYIRNIYALGKAINVKADLTLLNPKMIEKAISYPWSGAMFSDRIWDNKNKLVKNIREAILQSAVMGEGMDKIAKRINIGLENGYKNALRVARTETMRVAYVAEMDSLESNKSVIEEVEHSAFWDKRTCKTCKGLDGEVYEVGKERMLPIHPHCRCTYLPVIPRIQEGDLSRYAEKAREQEYGEFREDVERDIKANLNAGRKKDKPISKANPLSMGVGMADDVADGYDYFNNTLRVSNRKHREMAEELVEDEDWRNFVISQRKDAVAYDAGLEIDEFENWQDIKEKSFKDLDKVKDDMKDYTEILSREIASKWNGTSGDSDKRAVALQLAVKEEFDLKDAGEFFDDRVKEVAEDWLKEHGGAYRTYARVQYEYTQKFLKEKGIEKLSVARGMKFYDIPDWLNGVVDLQKVGYKVADMQLNPISSFSVNLQTATGFAKRGYRGMVMANEVPRERIFSLYSTGMGTDWEEEIVVLGGIDETIIATDPEMSNGTILELFKEWEDKRK